MKSPICTHDNSQCCILCVGYIGPKTDAQLEQEIIESLEAMETEFK